MSARLNPRFDHGKTAPGISVNGKAVSAGAGPEALELQADVPITSREHRLEAEFAVRKGERTLAGRGREGILISPAAGAPGRTSDLTCAEHRTSGAR